MRIPSLLALVLVGILGLAGCGSEPEGPRLDAAAAIPEEVEEGTVLRVGDPQTQVALEESGLIDELQGFEVEWADISGGPDSLEAFRAGALDVSSVADIPPLFAHWTGTPVKIVAVRETVDPLEHPVYELGVAPGVEVDSLEDLEGKKIAYSPGQAQGALVLRALQEAGLSQDDVELIEIQSVDDVYVNALGSKQVDVAPLGGTLLASYLAKYGEDGGSSIKPGIRDDAWTLYAPVETVEDAHKAAALRKYVQVWAKAVQWINEHPDEFAQAFYVEHEGLSPEDAKYLVEVRGKSTVPTDWSDFIERHQATADLLAEEQDNPPVDVEELYDRRYEEAVAELGGQGEQGAEQEATP